MTVMAMPVPARPHRGIAIVPAAAVIAAAGIGVARSLVLAIGVRIELRAVAGIVDHLLRRRRRRKGRSGGEDGCRDYVFHVALLRLFAEKTASRELRSSGGEHGAKMIEAVIWDFGGVLTTSPFEAFARF